MKRLTLALGAAGLATVLAGAAWAQQHRMGGHDPFGNATITRAEAQAKAGEMFARLDVNRDGKLDQADRAAAMGARFDAMDANHDGALSRQEFIDAHARMMAGRDGEGPRMGAGMGAGMRPGMGRMMGGMKMLGRMDANGDRTITRDEFMAGALKRFDAADANHDGKLTPEERRAGMKRHMGAMGHGGDHDGDHDMDHGRDGHEMGGMPSAPPK